MTSLTSLPVIGILLLFSLFRLNFFVLLHLNHWPGSMPTQCYCSITLNNIYHTARCHSIIHSSRKTLPLACIQLKESFLVQINCRCTWWEDLPTQDEFQRLPEPPIGKDVDDGIAGWVEVSKPNEDIKDQWWRHEINEAVNQCVNGEGKPTQEVYAHSNAQSLGGFSFTLGSPSLAFTHGVDLLSLSGSNYEDLHIQADHDEAREKEHREV